MGQNITYDAFISSSHKDYEISQKITTALRTNGLNIVSQENIPVGEEFSQSIVNAIEASNVLLVLCTPNSIQSNWVLNEVVFASRLQKAILPIIVDKVKLPLEFDFLVSKYIHIDFDSYNPNKSIQQIIKITQQLNSKQSISAVEENLIKDHTISSEKSPNVHRYNKGEHIYKIKDLLRNVGIGFGIILYILLVMIAFIAKDYIIGVLLLSPSVIGLIAYVTIEVKSSKYDLKLYCEEENAEDDSLITISIDDKNISTINGKGFIRLSERKGTYLISIESKNKNIESERFEYTFNKNNHGSIKRVILKSKSSKNQAIEQKKDLTRFMCFIAGSTRLVNERNATRAVLSILYNKWERYDLVISSYTFEDFSNSYTVGGQQMLYDEFIEEKANCAIFIVENGVGEKTLGEYRLAVQTFKQNLQRPKIFVYANQLKQEGITLQFIEEVRKNQSYWREYQDINQLMSLIKEDIDGELFNIFVLNKGLQTEE